MDDLVAAVLYSFSENLHLNTSQPTMALRNTTISHRFRHALVGRTLLSTGRNCDDIMDAVRNHWWLIRPLEIILVTDEVFIFNFPNHEEDVQQVLRNQPWSVYGQVFLLNRFVPGTPPHKSLSYLLIYGFLLLISHISTGQKRESSNCCKISLLL